MGVRGMIGKPSTNPDLRDDPSLEHYMQNNQVNNHAIFAQLHQQGFGRQGMSTPDSEEELNVAGVGIRRNGSSGSNMSTFSGRRQGGPAPRLESLPEGGEILSNPPAINGSQGYQQHRRRDSGQSIISVNSLNAPNGDFGRYPPPNRNGSTTSLTRGSQSQSATISKSEKRDRSHSVTANEPTVRARESGRDRASNGGNGKTSTQHYKKNVYSIDGYSTSSLNLNSSDPDSQPRTRATNSPDIDSMHESNSGKFDAGPSASSSTTTIPRYSTTTVEASKSRNSLLDKLTFSKYMPDRDAPTVVPTAKGGQLMSKKALEEALNTEDSPEWWTEKLLHLQPLSEAQWRQLEAVSMKKGEAR